MNLETEIKILYKNWPKVRIFLKTKGCGSTQAEDIFQEALLVFVRKREQNNFEAGSKEALYHFMNIAKFLWYNENRKKGLNTVEFSNESASGPNQHSNINNDYSGDPEIETFINEEKKYQLMEEAISKIGAKCQQILKAFYGLGMKMSEIAKKFDLRNEAVAKVQKYRCLTKAKEIIHANSQNS